MAGNMNVGISAEAHMKQLIAEFNKTTSAAQVMNAEMMKAVKSFTALSTSMNNAKSGMVGVAAQNKKLNAERQKAVVTAKRLAQSETLLGAIYTKNSAVAQKKYLQSITGLRKGLARFRDETHKVMIMEKGHISMLNEQENAMKRFMIVGNMTSRTLDNMATKYLNLGKNLQWTGRQLMVGLTLPIAAAGFGAVRSYREWDKAIVRTTKLLEDQVDAQGNVTKTSKQQSEALQKHATTLSTTYGTARSSIMGDTMGIFAQIGATEEEIKRLSKMSLDFNVLGDLDDTAKAGEMVRVLFQNFRTEFKTSEQAIAETSKTLQIFNAIEDETSLSMEGIAEAYPKVANTLRRMNVGAGEGMAFLSAMTQQGISATESANALNFALNKLPAAGAYLEDPSLSGEAKARLKILTDAIERYNSTASVANRIDLFGPGGSFKGADQAIMQVSRAWSSMNDAQREVFNRAIAGSNQTNRLGTLFENVGKSMTGNMQQDFYKAMNLANDAEGATSRWQKQLKEVLGSDYIAWDNILQRFRNTIQDIGKEVSAVMLPVAQKLAGWLEKAFTWFKNLDESTKRWALSVVGLVAIIGPLIYGVGQLVILSAQFAKMVFTKPLKAMFSIAESTGGAVVKTQRLKDSVNELMDSYLSGNLDQSGLKKGLRDVLAEEKALEAQTKRTTAALRNQGMVDATPIVGGPGAAPSGMGALAPSARNTRLRDKLKSIFSPASQDVSGLRPRIMGVGAAGATSALTLAELEQLAPDILQQAMEREGFMSGKGTGAGIGPMSRREKLKLGGVKWRDVVSPDLYPTAQALADTDSEIARVGRQLKMVRSPEYKTNLGSIFGRLKRQSEEAGAEAKQARVLRRQYDKIGRVLAHHTTLTPEMVSDPKLMAKLFDDIERNIDQRSYLGNPVVSERTVIKALDKITAERPDMLPRGLRRVGGTVAKGRASAFLKELNERGVHTDFAPGRETGTGRSSSFGYGRSMQEILGGNEFFPENTRRLFGAANFQAIDERTMAAMPSSARYLREGDPLYAPWKKYINDPKNLDGSWAAFQQAYAARQRSGKVKGMLDAPLKRGAERVSRMTGEWSDFKGGPAGDLGLDQFLRGGPLGQAAVGVGDIGKVSPELMEKLLQRLTGGIPDSEIFSAMSKDVKGKLKGRVSELEKEFKKAFSVKDFDGDSDVFASELKKFVDDDDQVKRLRDTEMALRSDPKRGGNRAQIKKAMDDLTDQTAELMMLDAGEGMDPVELQKDIDAAKKQMRRTRELSTSKMINAYKASGKGLPDGVDIVDDMFDFSDADVAADALDKLDDQINALDDKAKTLDSKRKRLLNRFNRNTSKAVDREIDDLTKMRNDLYNERKRLRRAYRKAADSRRTDVPFDERGNELAEGDLQRILYQTQDPEREAATQRVVADANRRLAQNEDRLRRAGVDDSFDKNVRRKLANQIDDPSRRRREFGKAFFSAGLLGRFDGRMDPEEIQARAQLMERNAARGMPDAEITKSEIRAQKALGPGSTLIPGMHPGAEKDERKSEPRRKRAREGLKKIGGSAKEAAKSGAKLAKPGNLLAAATYAQPTKAVGKFTGSMRKMAAGSKTLAKMGTAGKGLLPVFDMMTMGMGGVAVQGVTAMAALGPLILVIGALVGIGLLLWKNWDKVSKGIGRGLDVLKEGFKAIIDAVVGPFKNMIKDLNSDGEGMGNMWENIGKIINVAGHVIGAAFKVIAAVLKPVFTLLANLVRIIIKTVQLVVAVLTGDWKSAWEAARDVLGTIVIAIGNIIMFIPSMLVEALGAALDLITGVLDKIPGWLSDRIPGFEGVRDGIDAAARSVHNFGDEINDLPEDLGKRIRGDKEAAEDAADMEHTGYEDTWSNFGKEDGPVTPGPEANTDEAVEAAEDERKAYVEAFVSAFRGQMQKVVDNWKQAALNAYDDWVEAQQSAIDAQIDGIRELTKVEEEELKKREYIRQREEMMNNMRAAKNKYILDRDKLIYEGKYDEAAELDTQYEMDKQQGDREFEEHEENHQRDLLLAERDGQVERLEQEKEHNKEKFDLQKEALQKQLDLITEYTPKNAGEAAKMQQAILDTMNTFIPGYGAMATASQEAWRGSWNSAWSATSRQVAEDSFWSGKEALKQFAKGLGIDPGIVDDAVGDFAPSGSGGGAEAKKIDYSGQYMGGKAKDVHYYHQGGNVGNTSMAPADVDATLQTGEYVVRRSAVAKYGKAFLDRINNGAGDDSGIYHTGGIVGKAFKGMANKAFGSFFNDGASIGGGLTWDAVKAAWRTALGGAMGVGEGFFGKGEDPGEFINRWVTGGPLTGINKDFVMRFARYAQALGRQLNVTPGSFRTYAQQADLKRRKGIMAAAPGGSWHEKGMAIDHSPHSIPAWRKIAEEKFGLYYPMASPTAQTGRGSIFEPWHIQPIETRGKSAREHQLGEGFGGDGHASTPGNTSMLNQELLQKLMGSMIPGGTVTQGKEEIKAIVRGMMAAFGWGDSQWHPLDLLISNESGWNPNAANPTSSARGLFQKLTSVNGPIEPTVQGQAQWGMNYIKGRYGTPAEAWRMWNSRSPHWYHGGGMVEVPKFHEGNYQINKTGLAEVAKGEQIKYADQGGGSGDVHLHFEGGFFGTDREIAKLGKEIDRVMAKNNRAKGFESRTFSSR